MKNIAIVFAAFLSLLFVSCEGNQGPPGRDGLPGLNGTDGDEFLAAAFELSFDLGFDPDNNRYISDVEPYPTDITLDRGDVLLVYRLEAVDNGIDIWRQLPQPVFSDQGLLYYNFDFTFENYTILLEPEFDVADVTNDFTDGQVFRMVVLPTDLSLNSKVDKSNINEVMKYLGISENDIQKVQLN